MKQRVIEITGKLLVALAFGLSLIGIAQANVPAQPKASAKRQQVLQTLRGQVKKEAPRQLVNNKGVVSEINQASFELGQRFVIAAFEAEGLDYGDEGYVFVVTDLVELIDKFEGRPESVELQKILKAVVRSEMTGAEMKVEIERISRGYLATLAAEQQWYFKSGENLFDVLIACYLFDEEGVKNSLSELQALIKIAPTETPSEMLDPMGALVKYIAQTTISEEDYYAIFDNVAGINDLIIG